MTGRPTGESLRVAVFAESYLPYLSGVTVATEALARGLHAAGHDVLLVAPRPARGSAPGSAGAAGPDPDAAWLPSIQLPRPGPPGYRVPWPIPSAALRAAAAFRPDIVHAQSPFVSGLMARRIARRAGVPLVFTHHTRFGDYRHYLGPLGRPGAAAMSAYLGRFWAGCAAIVAPGSDLGDEISAQLAAGRRPVVRVIPTGIDTGSISRLEPNDARPAAGWPSDTVVAVSVGRLAPEKSTDLVVEAFALAVAEEPTLRLLLVGGGPLEVAVRARIAEPDLAARAYLTGARPRLAALALLRGADLFVFASQTETQGLVIAEALAAGVPVVAIDGHGVRDSVRDGVDGEILAAAPEGTRQARLADAMVGLARDRQRRAALSRAALDGSSRFDVAERIAEMVDLYRSLIARRS